MFVLKKLVSSFIFPVPLVLEISAVGLCLLWFKKRQQLGRWLVTLSFILLTLLSTGIVADLLLAPLERQYAPLFETASLSEPIVFVVVLGGGHVSDSSLPALSQAAPETLIRLAEGIRLHRQFPGSKLLLSGRGSGPVPNARVMAAISRQLGVNPADIVIEDQSRDTRQEAQLIKPMLGGQPFVLATSASHMPRSMGAFRKLGMEPIPAPVGHYVKGARLHVGNLVPSARHLVKSAAAFYEYMGLAWYRVRGHI